MPFHLIQFRRSNLRSLATDVSIHRYSRSSHQYFHDGHLENDMMVQELFLETLLHVAE
jgi:hypothetical protein